MGAILGTAGDDTLTGTNADDIICGMGGNDQIYGLAGNDQIYGGDGSDVLVGGNGNDFIFGDFGADDIQGSLGDDDLDGGSGDDSISGGPGADNLFGQGGIDILLGGADNDGLNGGADSDQLDGETGTNSCFTSSGDTLTNCFYDQKPPSLISVALDPAQKNYDSTKRERLHIRAYIKDPGSGVMKIGATFSVSRQNVWFGNHNGGVSLYDVEESNCDSLYASTLGGYCLVSGTSSRGIFDIFLPFQENMVKSKWSLTELALEDAAQNRMVYGWKQLAAKKISVSFNQLTKADTKGPTIQILPNESDLVLTSSRDKVVFTFRLTDPSTTASLDIDSKYSDFSYGLRSIPSLSTCSDLTILPCKIVNSPTDVTVKLGVAYAPGPYDTHNYRPFSKCICSFYAQDRFGNATFIDFTNISKLRKSHTINKSYSEPTPNDDLDTYQPVIASVTVLTPKIDTGSALQSARFRVRVKDRGLGLDIANPSVYLSIWTRLEQNQQIVCTKSNVVGTSLDFTVDFACEIPAHYRQGKLYVSYLSAIDISRRHNDTTIAIPDSEFPVPEPTEKVLKLFVTNG